jgi:hypothetical protein
VILRERVRAVADAILYEGYALYPYRASSLKNQQRWMLGSLYPRDVAAAASEPWRLRCACLLEAPADAEVEVLARFLRFEARVGESWDEAVPEDIHSGLLRLGDVAAQPHRERFAKAAVQGEVELAAEPITPGVYRMIVTVENLTPLAALPDDSAQARRSSLASAHALLAVRGGSFVSLLDPPPHLAAAAEGCRNAGAWPVLAGAPGERDIVLCSPIILDDHPQVAPESPGDFFDGTEMDEMLTLRILTMTDAEKREAAATDGRVRALLERTQGLAPEQIARLHGAVRNLRPRTVRARGQEIGPGSRVRLHPSGRSDILDLALEGEEATVTSIETDYEDRTFVTVTVDADPGRDFGARGLPAHRFFFRPDEVEPLGGLGGREGS